MSSAGEIAVRATRPADFGSVIELCHAVYPHSPAWTAGQLQSHLTVFPEGQLVAEHTATGEIVGMAASLIVLWDDYEMGDSWRDFTDSGMFTNHDPNGRTLYGAEIMIHPARQGQGIGTRLYRAREALARRLGLRRIRAGARLRGYHRYAATLTAQQYAREVEAGRLTDPTLTFQLRRGFHVIGVAKDYLRFDPDSLGYAAVIEWTPDGVEGRT